MTTTTMARPGAIAFPARQQSFSGCSAMYIIEPRENESLPSSPLTPVFSFFLCLPAYTEVYVRLPLGLSKSEFSASSMYFPSRSPLPPLRSPRSLSRNLFLSVSLLSLLSLAVSSVSSNVSVSFPRSVSPVVATSEFESRRVEGSSLGREEEGALSKCYPLGLSAPLPRLFLSLFLSLALPHRVSFSLPSARISPFLLSSGGQRTGARRDRNHTHARCEPARL